MPGVLAAIQKKSNRLLNVPALCFTAGLFSLFVQTAFSQVTLTPLVESQIRQNMLGKMFTGEYPDGTRWAERFNRNYTSNYSESGRLEQGVVTINGGVICFDYPKSPEQVGGCFEVWKRGPNCFDFYATGSDASMDQRRFGRGWSARGWDESRPSTCLSEEIS